MRDRLARIKKLSRELKTMENVLGLLNWDMRTHMPRKGGAARAEQQALMQTMHHEKVVSREMGGALRTLVRDESMKDLSLGDRALVREMWRKHTRAKRVPPSMVEEMARLDSLSYQRWVVAREKGDFDAFAPYLSKQVSLKKMLARRLGFDGSPYDALLDIFEPGSTASWTEGIFEILKKELVALVRRIAAAVDSPPPALLVRSFDTEKQRQFGLWVLERMGFDLEAGRQDESVHPFTASCGGVGDVRVTTRLKPKDFRAGLFGTLHEGGHALYEQGFGKPVQHGLLGCAASCALHESQARLWENLVGRSLPFWKYWYPKLKRLFPENLKGVRLSEFHRVINRVAPSFVRVEADEVTYALHIILRFELERDLIEGRLSAKRVPGVWNAKMKAYLGVSPPNDRLGVLQDVHWSSGYFGYFPSYALGNLYASQFYAAATRAMPDLEERIERGDYGRLLSWLRRNIHRFGRIYTAADLVKKVTKEPLDPTWFLDYLRKKYGVIYGISRQGAGEGAQSTS